MKLFDKFYGFLCVSAYKKAPKIQKYKKHLTDKEKKTGVIKNGVTLFMPGYKKYFFCDKETGEGWFFRYKPITEEGEYPIVIYHHGNGLNRAGKNYMQMFEFSWLKKRLNKQKCHQVVMHADVACEYNTDGHSRALEGVIEYIQNTYNNVDLDRIYLAGTSHGGYACVYEVLRNPDKYAAVVISMAYTFNEAFVPDEDRRENPFVRCLTEEDYKTLTKTPFYISWAKDDSVCMTTSNELLSKNIKGKNIYYKEKVYETGGHTIASNFFKNGDWDEWMFNL